jgi:hypothetical protein
MSGPLVVSIPHRLGKDEAPFTVSDQRTWPSGKRLNRRGRGLCSVGGLSAVAPGEARRNATAADPQARHVVIGKEIRKRNCLTLLMRLPEIVNAIDHR